MKKTLTILFSILILILVFSACTAKNNETKNKIQNTTKQNLNTIETVTESEAKDDQKNQQSESVNVDNTDQQTASTDDSANSEADSENVWFFKSIDFAGNELNSQEYFANGKLTLVNIWATWCPPCKMELPDLGQLAKDFAEQNVQFLGIATDVIENDQNVLDIAKSLLSDSGVEYPNVKFNEQTNNIMLQYQIQSIPTTVLIDAKGNVIGDLIIGIRNYDDFSNLINSALDLIE
ncbi:MAG: TlpA family protein disulfide reductase [Clostridiaceae bacterium]|nr:TlpA family protein disulfide reductase [Clostridiaceae bacterium]